MKPFSFLIFLSIFYKYKTPNKTFFFFFLFCFSSSAVFLVPINAGEKEVGKRKRGGGVEVDH